METSTDRAWADLSDWLVNNDIPVEKVRELLDLVGKIVKATLGSLSSDLSKSI